MFYPIRFQPLEKELEPVLKYLTGNVLNAGCGDRDISQFLISNAATSVNNCDIQSSIPNAIVCDLAEIPLPADTYDSILCNAVLEHVQLPDLVMKEFYRLLKVGGILVLSVPFLQPYHPTPKDFRRYTTEGLRELGQSHNFEVVEILPVHSLAQTVTWIVWSYLQEKRQWLMQSILLVPFYLWNLVSQRTDFAVKHHANSYQMILRKKS